MEDGLVAYAIGPFGEKADCFLIPARQGPTMRVGRYLGYSYMDINVKFQDHSVMYNAAEIQFKRSNKGFRVRCTPGQTLDTPPLPLDRTRSRMRTRVHAHTNTPSPQSSRLSRSLRSSHSLFLFLDPLSQ